MVNVLEAYGASQPNFCGQLLQAAELNCRGRKEPDTKADHISPCKIKDGAIQQLNISDPCLGPIFMIYHASERTAK